MSTTTDQTERNPFTTKWFMGSAVVVLAILIAATYLIIHAILTPDTTTSTPAAAPTQDTGVGCGAPASDQTTLTSAPAHTWRLVGAGENSMSVPVFDDGPTKWEDGLPSCWGHSPAGAVSAATTFIALSSTGQEHTLYQDYTVQGPARDKGLDGTATNGAVGTTGLSFTAFRVVDYTQDTAEVELIISGVVDGSVVNMAATVTETYTDGDWRYDPPTSLNPTTRVVTDTTGFVELSKGE